MKQKSMLILLALILIGISHIPVNAAPIDPLIVNDTRDLGEVMPGDGLCDNGEGGCSLRAAVEEANAFGPNNGVAVEIEIDFSGDRFVLQKEIDIDAEIILYGNNNTISGAEETRLFTVTEKGDFTLTDMTLSDGKAKDFGGAIYNAGKVQLEHCTLLFNQAGKSGGAIYTTYDSRLLIFGGSEFRKNGAVNGGAIHNEGGYTLIIEGLLHQNWAVGDIGSGGAIYTDREGITEISWSILTENSASFNGGAIQGGGADSGASLWIRDSTIADNRAYQGGGISTRDADMALRRVTISGNVVVERGGGLYLSSVYIGVEVNDIVNSTISGNSAGTDGGGLYLNTRDVRFSNVTITENIADSDGDRVGQGGGIFSPTVWIMKNTILAGNIDTSNSLFSMDAPDCVGKLLSKDYNLIGIVNSHCKVSGATSSYQAGSMDAPLDPMLDALQPFDNKATHPLLPGSPAIDAGPTTGCTDNQDVLLTWDQPGTPRPLDGDGDSIKICDIGAVEYIP